MGTINILDDILGNEDDELDFDFAEAKSAVPESLHESDSVPPLTQEVTEQEDRASRDIVDEPPKKLPKDGEPDPTRVRTHASEGSAKPATLPATKEREGPDSWRPEPRDSGRDRDRDRDRFRPRDGDRLRDRDRDRERDRNRDRDRDRERDWHREREVGGRVIRRHSNREDRPSERSRSPRPQTPRRSEESARAPTSKMIRDTRPGEVVRRNSHHTAAVGNGHDITSDRVTPDKRAECVKAKANASNTRSSTTVSSEARGRNSSDSGRDHVNRSPRREIRQDVVPRHGARHADENVRRQVHHAHKSPRQSIEPDQNPRQRDSKPVEMDRPPRDQVHNEHLKTQNHGGMSSLSQAGSSVPPSKDNGPPRENLGRDGRIRPHDRDAKETHQNGTSRASPHEAALDRKRLPITTGDSHKVQTWSPSPVNRMQFFFATGWIAWFLEAPWPTYV
ncbi:hypothetical protein DFJ77DRAFT_123974 [Powellomyces hirtus]|nr:hypothetical protein DFJ77DRAFT_123974 [Powellomyces hirtus]